MGTKNVVVVGLGYVGLPLAVAFSKSNSVIGYDISASRIRELREFSDSTGEVSPEELRSTKNLSFQSELPILSGDEYIIICLPTPVDEQNRPDMRGIVALCRTLSPLLALSNAVCFESTVYPGATEELFLPALRTRCPDFVRVGYSPERINPGDKIRTYRTLNKVVSANDSQLLDELCLLYQSSIDAQVVRVTSIKVAEASKVIENTQRDLNIAFMNELYMLFEETGIDMNAVLEAASTKWNFLNFRPGLVGGHCIGVDPYYLEFWAQSKGRKLQLISAGRHTNQLFHAFLSGRLERAARIKFDSQRLSGLRALVVGISFKENVPDTRNSGNLMLINTLARWISWVDFYDPYADDLHHQVMDENCTRVQSPTGKYDVLVLAVPHELIMERFRSNILPYLVDDGIFYDYKGVMRGDNLSKSKVTYLS